MKFIIRNLGWILLIIFFVFMLYLISNQNNNLNNTSDKINTWSVLETRINNSNKTISSEVKIDNNENNFIDKIKDFFTFKKSNDKSENNLENNIELSKNNIENNIKSKEIEKKEEKNIGIVDKKLIKEVDDIVSNNKWDSEKNNNIEDNIKKVAVKSIFLNNAYFTKKLYTAYKGDKLEQLTPTNKYWCFKVKVISSKVSTNNWKIAWTCEYYMEWKTNTLEKYKKIASNYYSNLKTFKVNSLHKIKVSALKLNNSNFTKKLWIIYKNDLVKQLTPTNKYWCFKIKIISSKNYFNNWKIAWACKKYLK